MNSRLKLIAVQLLLVTACGHSVKAELTAYEPFNYTLGAFANGTATTGTGFTGNWAVSQGNASMVAGLTYPDLIVNDNSFSLTPNGRGQATLANSLSSGSTYISWLFRLNGNGGGNKNGLFLPGDGVDSLFVGFNAPFSATQGNIGLGSIATSSATATGTSNLAQMSQLVDYNATHLMVLEIVFNTSGANDTINLWVNPTAGVASPTGYIGTPPNPSLTFADFNVGAISGIGFNMQGGVPSMQLDELRVGSTFGDVVTVPEPSVFALLGFGALALLLARRRCR